jgi:hypothetical protein
LRLTFDARGYSPNFNVRAGDAVFVRANLVTKSDAVHENTTLVKYVYHGYNQIKGFVWNDMNRNGLHDDDEPPIVGAQVTLTTRRTSDNTVIPVTGGVTKADGTYVLEEKQPTDSRYVLSIVVDDKYGFTRRLEVDFDTLRNDSDVDFDGKRKDFQVERGQMIRIDAGVVEKKYMSCIKGVVWLDEGNGIRDPYDSTMMIQNANITLNRYSGHPESRMTTGTDGRYNICVLPLPVKELYTLTIVKQGHTPTKQLNPEAISKWNWDSDIDEDGDTIQFHVMQAQLEIEIDAGLKTAPPPTSTQPKTPTMMSTPPKSLTNTPTPSTTGTPPLPSMSPLTNLEEADHNMRVTNIEEEEVDPGTGTPPSMSPLTECDETPENFLSTGYMELTGVKTERDMANFTSVFMDTYNSQVTDLCSPGFPQLLDLEMVRGSNNGNMLMLLSSNRGSYSYKASVSCHKSKSCNRRLFGNAITRQRSLQDLTESTSAADYNSCVCSANAAPELPTTEEFVALLNANLEEADLNVRVTTMVRRRSSGTTRSRDLRALRHPIRGQRPRGISHARTRGRYR